ncbi:hypothetical protein FF38_01877 [Lucilia cuprina]|uniref:THAP-type domain-containing protein n=1 Tax=Lucilia cuprina TaxID=7375 RepID=A0A0L0BQ59_LUCCU|nr:hypothetical protein FF38_01877 [Lucilia cuprina]
MLKLTLIPILPGKRQQWLERCKTNEENLPKESMVCSDHLFKSDITINSKRARLDRDAIPITTRVR